MTPFEFLTQVKDHVTDTTPSLTDAERKLLRSVSVQYLPPGTDALMELGDIISGGFHFGWTGGGERCDGVPGNLGQGSEEIGPIVVYGFAHLHKEPCVLAFTVIHEMAHVLEALRRPGYMELPGGGHDAAWAEQCKRLGIFEKPYDGNGKNIAMYRECGISLNKICDPALLAWVQSLGPITDWDRPKFRRVVLD